MFSDYQNIMASLIEGSIAVVAMNRPDAANALNSTMALELEDAFLAIAESPACRVVILTGQGKHFCAGADLKERQGMNEEAWHAQHASFERAVNAVLSSPVPVIAAVNGAAFGGGFELALACDFIYAGQGARFALTEASLGIMPGMGGTQTLPRRIGHARAKEIAFRAAPFMADEALDWGIVNRVCTPEALLEESLDCALSIAANAPLAVQSIKALMHAGANLALPEALILELEYYNGLLDTKDRHEGITAYNEKRKPVFKGE